MRSRALEFILRVYDRMPIAIKRIFSKIACEVQRELDLREIAQDEALSEAAADEPNVNMWRLPGGWH